MRKGLSRTVPWAEACTQLGTTDVRVLSELSGRTSASIEKNWKLRGVPQGALARMLKEQEKGGTRTSGHQNDSLARRFRIQKIQGGAGVELDNVPWDRFSELPTDKLAVLFPQGLYGFEGEAAKRAADAVNSSPSPPGTPVSIQPGKETG